MPTSGHVVQRGSFQSRLKPYEPARSLSAEIARNDPSQSSNIEPGHAGQISIRIPHFHDAIRSHPLLIPAQSSRDSLKNRRHSERKEAHRVRPERHGKQKQQP